MGDYKSRVYDRFIELGFDESVVTRTFAKIPSWQWPAWEERAYREEEIIKRFVHVRADPHDRNLSTLLNKKCHFDVYEKLLPLESLCEKSQFLDIAIEYILGFYSIITYKPIGPRFVSVTSAKDIKHVDGTYYFCCSWETAYIIAHNGACNLMWREYTDFSRHSMMYLSSSHEDALVIGDAWKGVWGGEVALVSYSVPRNIEEVCETKIFDVPNEEWSSWVSASRDGKKSHSGFVLGPMSANPKEISEHGAKPIAHDPPRMQLGVSDDEQAMKFLYTWFKAVYLFDKPVPEREYKPIPHWWGPMCPEYDWRSQLTYTSVPELEHEKTKSVRVRTVWQGSKKDVV